MFVGTRGFFCRFIPLTEAHRPILVSFVGRYPFKQAWVRGSLTFAVDGACPCAPWVFLAGMALDRSLAVMDRGGFSLDDPSRGWYECSSPYCEALSLLPLSFFLVLS